MVGEEILLPTVVAVGGYVGTKLFGTVLATMGDDINKLYAKGRDKIVDIQLRKSATPTTERKSICELHAMCFGTAQLLKMRFVQSTLAVCLPLHAAKTAKTMQSFIT